MPASSTRVVKAASIVAAALLTAWLGACSKSSQANTVGSAAVDPVGVKLLDAVARRLQRATTLTATQRSVWHDTAGVAQYEQTHALRARQSRQARGEHGYRLKRKDGTWETGSTSHQMVDGTHSWSFRAGDSVASRAALTDDGWAQLLSDSPIQPFTLPSDAHVMEPMVWTSARRADPTLHAIVHEGSTTLDGAPVEVVRWVKLYMQGSAPAGTPNMRGQDEVIDTTRFYISVAGDTLLKRVVSTTSAGERTEVTFDGLELDAPVAPAALVWTPPAGVRVSIDTPAVAPIGKKFPDFSVPAVAPGGVMTNVTLASALKGKRALVLWNWATHCGGCRVEFPYFQALAEEFAPRGVAVMMTDWYPLDSIDRTTHKELEAELVQRVMRHTRAPMTVLLDSAHAQTDLLRLGTGRVVGTAAVLDGAGTIQWAGSATDVHAIRRVLAKLAS